MKKITCIFIALVLIFTMSCQAFAGFFPENGNTSSEYFDTNLQISGTNSFGNMLSETIGDELNKQQENAGYNVISVEISGQTATVELETLCDSTVVVGIYDEPGVNLLMTASAPVTQDDEYVTVTFAQALPQYFFIKAYLVDRTTLRPLCTVYDCPNYTQEMQEFFAKTVYDFEPEKVLNLDSDVTNNFAVYSDNVTVIPRVEGVNTLVSQGEGVYVFAAADENIRSLQVGQIFSYEYAPGEVIIAKIAAVMENPDGTVTVSEQDTELEDAFEYIKIDTEAGMDKATVDNSHLQEGIEFVGMTHDSQPINADAYGIMPVATFEGEGEIGDTLTYNIYKHKVGSDNLNVTVKGSVEFGIKAKMKYYISHKLKYIEITLEYSVKLKANVSGKLELKFPIGNLKIIPIAGVTFSFTPSFLVEASAEIEWNVELSGSVGTRLSTDGNKDISKSPKFDSELKLEGKFALGVIIEPEITVVHEKIANVELKAEVKAEASGKLVGYDTSEEVDENKQHLCKLCIEGEVNAIINAEFKAKLLDNEKWEFKFNLLELKYKIKDFYYSFDYNEFSFTKCPHYKYKTTLLILDRFMRRVPGAEVEVSGDKFEKEKLTSDENGVVEVDMLEPGTYTAACRAEGFKDSNIEFEVKDSPLLKRIQLEFVDDRVLDRSKVVQVSVGASHTAAITENGDLYTWGCNTHGQLGNGLAHASRPWLWKVPFEEGIDSAVPIKIMSDVTSVSLGGALSAAIKENGDLYVWGDSYYDGNSITQSSYEPLKIASNVIDVHCCYDEIGYVTADGELYMSGFYDGDGRTESFKKIMDNAISIKFGGAHYAAITNTGDLYMWGLNACGAFGITTDTDYVEVPVKVMSNVISADIGDEHSAAITTDGSLYIWGSNGAAQIGNQSTENVYSPLKLMDNVAEVNLGKLSSSAVTTSGYLYTWGWNGYGQLGTGDEGGPYGSWGPHMNYDAERGDKDTPVAILGNVAKVDMGCDHSAAVTNDGRLYMWGWNDFGQLGDGTLENCYKPKRITIPADEPAPTSISTLSALPMAVAETSPTSGTFTGLLPNEIYNIYALRSRTAAEPLAASNLLYIAQATSDAAGNLPYNCELLEDCPNPIIFCKAMHEFALGNAEITAADVTRDSITVKWEPYPGADMYRVYRVMNGVYILEGETPSTEYTVSGLAAGSEYGFVVECRVNGEWSYHASDDVVYIGTESEPEFTPGDVNSDGRITSVDAVLVLRYLANFRDENANQDAMDYNGAGGITSLDAVLILRHIAGLD